MPVSLFRTDVLTVKDIIGTNLLMKLFGNLRRIKIFGVSHLPKESLAPACEFYPASFDTSANPCIEVLFHTTKIGKGNGSTKFKKLCINELKAIYGLSGRLDAPLFRGSNGKFLKASYSLLNGSNRLIFNRLNVEYAIR